MSLRGLPLKAHGGRELRGGQRSRAAQKTTRLGIIRLHPFSLAYPSLSQAKFPLPFPLLPGSKRLSWAPLMLPCLLATWAVEEPGGAMAAVQPRDVHGELCPAPSG